MSVLPVVAAVVVLGAALAAKKKRPPRVPIAKGLRAKTPVLKSPKSARRMLEDSAQAWLSVVSAAGSFGANVHLHTVPGVKPASPAELRARRQAVVATMATKIPRWIFPADTYARADGPAHAGLLFNTLDALAVGRCVDMYAPCKGPLWSTCGRYHWDADPANTIAAVRDMTAAAVALLAKAEGETEQAAAPPAGSSWAALEQMGADAATDALAATVPAGGALLAAAEEAGIGWSFSGGPQYVDNTAKHQAATAIAAARMADLVAYAQG